MPGALIRQQDALRQLLINSKRSDQLKNLYDHIIDVMDFVVVNYPSDAISKFEEVSYLIKQGDEAKLKQFLKTCESKRYAMHSDSTAKATKQYLERAQAMVSTVKKADAPADDDDNAAADAAPVCFMPDLIQDNKAVYQWAGLNFGDQQCMLLQKSMQNLAKSSGAAKLRFWGKITGTERDYWVVEATGVELPETGDEQPVDKEAHNAAGVNEFTYYVCNCPSENKWAQLPDLLPADIDIARKVKFHFSGDLERRIITNPFLHKREKFLLRAQIARIQISTSLAPKGMFRMQEDSTTEIELNEPEEGPIPVPSVSAMRQAANWVHHPKSILNCSRTALMEEEAPEGMEPEDFMKMR